MLIPTLIAAVILLGPISYVVWRKFSVVEQDITFATPQRGVAAFNVIIKEDTIHRLRIVYDDGQICEAFPAAAERRGGPARARFARRNQVRA